MYKVLRICILFVFLWATVSSCSKKNTNSGQDTQPNDTTVQPIDTSDIDDLSYGELIHEKTSLIKEINLDSTYEIIEGVQETHIRYVDRSDKPMSVFIVTVDISNPSISMEVGTPNDENILNAHQKVREMIDAKNNSSSDKEVVAAFNGDYWQIHSEQEVSLGYPLGPVVKKGNVLKEYPTNNYYFLGFLNNGKAYIGNNAVFQGLEDKITEGLGGRYRLIAGGKDKSSKVNKNVEPRTSVGLLNSQKVVFIVVDGRKADYSVGISMQGLAKMYKAIGAIDAINLDGGGSSTYIVKSGVDYITRNKPSDNVERAVVNSWMVMREK